MISYEFTNHAYRQFKKLSPDIRRRIIFKLEKYLNHDNPLAFADALTNVPGKVYRYRFGDYRVIFDWEVNSILILKVGHRRDIYN